MSHLINNKSDEKLQAVVHTLSLPALDKLQKPAGKVTALEMMGPGEQCSCLEVCSQTALDGSDF